MADAVMVRVVQLTGGFVVTRVRRGGTSEPWRVGHRYSLGNLQIERLADTDAGVRFNLLSRSGGARMKSHEIKTSGEFFLFRSAIEPGVDVRDCSTVSELLWSVGVPLSVLKEVEDGYQLIYDKSESGVREARSPANSWAVFFDPSDRGYFGGPRIVQVIVRKAYDPKTNTTLGDWLAEQVLGEGANQALLPFWRKETQGKAVAAWVKTRFDIRPQASGAGNCLAVQRLGAAKPGVFEYQEDPPMDGPFPLLQRLCLVGALPAIWELALQNYPSNRHRLWVQVVTSDRIDRDCSLPELLSNYFEVVRVQQGERVRIMYRGKGEADSRWRLFDRVWPEKTEKSEAEAELAPLPVDRMSSELTCIFRHWTDRQRVRRVFEESVCRHVEAAEIWSTVDSIDHTNSPRRIVVTARRGQGEKLLGSGWVAVSREELLAKACLLSGSESGRRRGVDKAFGWAVLREGNLGYVSARIPAERGMELFTTALCVPHGETRHFVFAEIGDKPATLRVLGVKVTHGGADPAWPHIEVTHHDTGYRYQVLEASDELIVLKRSK